MGRTTIAILRLVILVVLAANVHIHAAGCKTKKACKVLKGTCIGAKDDCDGQEVSDKIFCKGGNKCKCCFPSVQTPCPTDSPPSPTPTTTMRPPQLEALNLKPIIGILAQEPSSGMRRVLPEYTSYIAASYVKFIESGGARVVPILINQNDTYYEDLVESLNGIVFPGGSASITDSSGYGRAGRKIYDLVVASGQKGNPIPLWGTCLGFEMLMYLAADGPSKYEVLTSCKASGISLPLDLKEWKSSALLGSAPGNVVHPLSTMNITSNYHKYCVTPQTFAKYDLINDYFVISTNLDTEGLEFISTVEHQRLPIWGTQWHIEKNLFEWKYSSIPHFPKAIQVGHYFAQFFGDQARQNINSFSSKSEERSHLIYNYNPIYLTPYSETDGYYSSFHQAYFFN
ncbi:unnamed protein product [Meganyctiphanes norvegica]|uniref:folate gamma-glutamyl hydrolase n=1 Tax=Meganyctiphanes norvegica TaxID=48144 RepID=A0AAV2RMC1_MEGNR